MNKVFEKNFINNNLINNNESVFEQQKLLTSTNDLSTTNNNNNLTNEDSNEKRDRLHLKLDFKVIFFLEGLIIIFDGINYIGHLPIDQF